MRALILLALFLSGCDSAADKAARAKLHQANSIFNQEELARIQARKGLHEAQEKRAKKRKRK